MTNKQKSEVLKRIFWDYDIEKLPLDKIINGDIRNINQYEYALMINRMLERLSWFELLDLLGIDNIKIILTKETISRIRIPELRKKYEFIRKVLSGESISFTGRGDEYYSTIKHTLFSNRWYSTKQTLL